MAEPALPERHCPPAEIRGRYGIYSYNGITVQDVNLSVDTQNAEDGGFKSTAIICYSFGTSEFSNANVVLKASGSGINAETSLNFINSKVDVECVNDTSYEIMAKNNVSIDAASVINNTTDENGVVKLSLVSGKKVTTASKSELTYKDHTYASDGNSTLTIAYNGNATIPGNGSATIDEVKYAAIIGEVVVSADGIATLDSADETVKINDGTFHTYVDSTITVNGKTGEVTLDAGESVYLAQLYKFSATADTTVTFIYNGVTEGIPDITITEGDRIVVAAPVTYKVNGGEYTTTTENETIILGTYTVKLDANGGTGDAMADQTVTVGGQTVLAANTYTREGYHFAGWATTADAAQAQYGDGALVKLGGQADSTITLYAIWNPIQYTITYDLRDGVLPEGQSNPGTYTIESEDITLVNPVKAGYTFLGWYISGVSGYHTSVTIAKGSTGDRAYSANWKANTDTPYTKEFYLMQLDGTYPTEASETVAVKGTTDKEISVSATTKTGFTFDSENENNVTSGTITADGKLVLKYYYTRNQYTLTFDANGGTGGTSGQVYYGAAITAPTVTKEGYTFTNWDADVAETMPAADVTYTAQWIVYQKPECDGGEDCPGHNFKDYDPDVWYHDALDFVIEKGLMAGYGNGYFGPDDTLSRAMLVQILYSLEGKPAVSGDITFPDVAADQYYAAAVQWTAANGIVSGYGNGKFGPHDSITREQLAVMLWRYAGSPTATQKELSFSDVDEVSDWAMEALLWANENGIMNGCGDGTLNPEGNATRSHVAQMLKKYFENVNK